MNKFPGSFLTIIALLTLITTSNSCADTSSILNDNMNDVAASLDTTTEALLIPEETALEVTTNIETSVEEAERLLPDSEIFFYSSNIPADNIYADVLQKNWVVMNSSNIVCGIDLWLDFYNKTMSGEPSSVLIANYYPTAEYEFQKDKYPLIYLTEITYDGSIYKIIKRTGSEDKYSESDYKYIIKYEKATEDVYIAANQNTYTYNQLYNSLASANRFEHIDFIAVMHIPK